MDDKDSILIITAEESGDRIDALLARQAEELTRSAAQRLLERGMVLLGGRPVKKNYRCAAGDRFTVLLPEPDDMPLIAQDIPLDVVYEDQDVIVVNKPRGLVVHPAPGHPDGTLVNALLFHCGDSLSGVGGEKRPGIVHRIDKDTSGLLIAAKNDFAHRALSEQLSDRSLSRVYEAVARGSFREDAGTVDRPIGRHPTDRKRMAVTEKNARPAVTHWEVLARYQGYTHIRCVLETGRTHQIRAHMRHIGHPLFSDERYGGTEILRGERSASYKAFINNCFKICPRQALHAQTLGFVHPRTGKQMDFSSPMPDDLAQLIEKWHVRMKGNEYK